MLATSSLYVSAAVPQSPPRTNTNGTSPDQALNMPISMRSNTQLSGVLGKLGTRSSGRKQTPPTLAETPSMNQNTNPAWPAFKHDDQRAGLSTNAGVMSNAELWQFSTSSSIDTTDYYSSPVASLDGTTIYYAAGNSLYAFGALTGTQIWEYTLPSGVTFEGSTPAIGSDGTIYIGATDGNLYAISPSGTLDWTYSAGGSPPGGYSFYGTGIESSPLIGPDGTIYFGSENGYLYALTPPTTAGGSPTLAWDYLTAQPPSGDTCGVQVSCGIFTSSPALSPAGSTIYIGGEDGNLYAISPPSTSGSTTGTLVWKAQLGDVVNTPAVTPDGKTIYISQQSGELYSVNTTNGSVNWKTNAGADYSSPAVGPDGTVYVSGCAYSPAANPNSPGYGISIWSYCPPGFDFASSSPAVDVNGIMYVGGYSTLEPDPGIFAVYPGGGIGAWYFDAGKGSTVGSPIIGADGTIYFDSINSSGVGTLYAIGGASSPRSVPTPKVDTNVPNAPSPYGLALNPGTGQVFASSCSSISVIDGSSNTGTTANNVIDTIYAPPPVFPQKSACYYGEVFDTTNGELYAIDANNNAVVAINGATFSIEAGDEVKIPHETWTPHVSPLGGCAVR